MIYTEIPEYLTVDIDTFEAEREFFFKNLPPQEQNKLKQFTQSPLCGTYYIDIYKPNTPGLWNLHLNLVDKEPLVNPRRYSSKYIEALVDNTLYEYASKYNFFKNTVQTVINSPKINSITLLYFKPQAILPCHKHGNPEFVAHTLLNHVGDGCLRAYSEESVIELTKKGQTFMHETHLPHGGRATTSELWILSVTTDYFK